MSTVLPPERHARRDEFVPPPYAEPHIRRQLDDLLGEVEATVAPVWPLKDYVAVNPYAGFSGKPFDEATRFVRLFSDCEMLMPMAFFAGQWEQGGFGMVDMVDAIRELGFTEELSARDLVKELAEWTSIHAERESTDESSRQRGRLVRTIAEVVESIQGVPWPAMIQEEITKHCAAHYDQGEASWTHPSRHLPLYQAWHSRASVDLSPELNGLTGFRRFVKELPNTADAAILVLLEKLGVPEPWWQTFLLCQAFSIPGWSAWTKYQSEWNHENESENKDFIGLLAMRLAYDAALSEVQAVNLGWHSLAIHEAETYVKAQWPQVDAKKRLVLLRAMELCYRNRLIQQMDVQSDATEKNESTNRKLAQLAFCIDVRSERLRRHLEATSAEIETYGFAGFFAMPVEHIPLGCESGNAHLPVLLKPTYQLQESVESDNKEVESAVVSRRHEVRNWRRFWKQLKTSSVGCFPFVETVGLTYAGRMLRRVLGIGNDTPNACCDGLEGESGHSHRVVPQLNTVEGIPSTWSQQVELAEGLLRGLGLTDHFARLVVFCGHSSQTSNNPLAASLDCGACGGHSGEPNARLAAHLLNQSEIRQALTERGITIPQDSYFLAGHHNTTTDEVTLFDLDRLPTSHQGDAAELTQSLKTATHHTLAERMPTLDANDVENLHRKAVDWSEVRPEWGLAGNAAIVIAPREMTKRANLDGRSFLHSYDHRRDVTGAVLETIMGGPMVVAHWINMQYYASSVDPARFGSGSKTVHNVVGQFGLLSGSAGDLMTGLPWQSVHTGDDFQHLPLRLQVMIAAPRVAIQRVIQRHAMINDLLNNQWLHLAAIEDGVVYHYGGDGRWNLSLTSDAPATESASTSSAST